MKTGIALKNGFKGATKAWKGVVVIWLTIFVLALIVKSPIKNSLIGAYGDSMLVEELSEVLNAEALTDLGLPFVASLLMQIVKTSLLIYLISFLLNAFFTGGLFEFLTDSSREFKIPSFLKHSSDKFLSFLWVKISVFFLIFASLLLLFLFGYLLISASGVGKIVCLALFVAILWFTIEMLAAGDFARARLEMEPSVKGTKAMGFGLKAAFKYIRESVSVVLPILLIQLALTYVTITVVVNSRISTSACILLMTLAAQVVVFVKTFVKIWRFASFTELAVRIPRNVAPANTDDTMSSEEYVDDNTDATDVQDAEDVTAEDNPTDVIPSDINDDEAMTDETVEDAMYDEDGVEYTHTADETSDEETSYSNDGDIKE